MRAVFFASCLAVAAVVAFLIYKSLPPSLPAISFPTANRDRLNSEEPAPAVSRLAPGTWTGPLLPPASPEQRVTVILVPFWAGGKGGLMTPTGRVVVPATYPTLPAAIGGHRRLWKVGLAGRGPLRVALLAETGRVLGHFASVERGQDWGWTLAKSARGTLTLFDSLGHLVRATPYGKLEPQSEGLAVVSLPDSILPDGSGGIIPGRQGMIDSQAREVIPARYEMLHPFDRGYAYVLNYWQDPKRRQEGVLDHHGRPHWLKSPWREASLHYLGGFFAGFSNERQAAVAIDVDGRVLVPYSAGLSSISRELADLTGLLQVKKYIKLDGGRGTHEAIGFYDNQFRPVIPPAYQHIPEVYTHWAILEGFTPAIHPPLLTDPPRGALYHNRVVLPADCGRATITRDGRFALGTLCEVGGGFRQVICESGQAPRPYPAGVTDVRYVSNGVFAACRAGRWGLIRATGQVLRPYQDKDPRTQLLLGGYYSQGASSAGPDLCDTLGRPVVPAGRYDEVRFATPDLAVVRQRGRYGILSRANGLLVPVALPTAPIIQANGTFCVRAPDQPAVLYCPDGQRVRTLAVPDFVPFVCVGPYLVLGALRNGQPALYNRQGQLLSQEVTGVQETFRDGVIWAHNATGRFALFDVQGQQLTPFRYELDIDLHENFFPFNCGLGGARDNTGRFVWVDCRGHAYAW